MLRLAKPAVGAFVMGANATTHFRVSKSSDLHARLDLRHNSSIGVSSKPQPYRTNMRGLSERLPNPHPNVDSENRR